MRGASTKVKSCAGLVEKIPVGVGPHQRSSRSPYLFDLIMDVVSHGITNKREVAIVHAAADDIVLCSSGRAAVETKLEQWRGATEDSGLNSEYIK